MKNTKEIISPSEAVYGFAAWLTTRDEPAIFSAHHDAAPIADLVKQFCDRNNLERPREDYHKRLKLMNDKKS